ncbi:adenosylcobinamide-phosphate synthase CbiB [Pararhodobacter oceanensis]|uniref:adenosylcobinamide-phosphate synthase CbiB n=1 Tax=Pararhodobacter oceanensis TaxID=2172121 RepID=UPI003A9308FD
MGFAAVMLIAVALDLAVGWPPRLYAAVGHPVTWFGALISALDRRLNHEGDSFRRRKRAGVVAALFCIAGIAAITTLVQLLANGPFGLVLLGILCWPFIAMRSMYEHVAAVANPLKRQDLPEARHQVSMIVGRDTKSMDESAVARAALESLAENTSDGVIAPLFWGLIFGLPGIATYKMINTLDSMIGHRSKRHEAFGWASARIDDLVNLPASRLTGLLFALASRHPRAALHIIRRDARKHRSPNAGWSEAAMAAALQVRLSGPRVYAEGIANEPWVNARGADPDARDLRRGLALYARAMILGVAALAGLALI